MSMILIGDREVIADVKRKEESEKAVSDQAAAGTDESQAIEAAPELADATETEPTETEATETEPTEEAATQK